MSFEWNFRELMRPRLADAYARRTYETLPEQPTNPMPTQMDPQGQGWLAAQQARNAQNMQGYMPNDAKQGYGQDYEDRAQSIAGEVGQDYYGNAGGDRGVVAAQVTPNQIKDLQSQIEVIEKRLTENKAKLKNWDGNANKIAALEARKINVNDPTSIWRWKESQNQAKQIRKAELEYAKAEKEAAKKLAKQQVLNKVANTLGTINFNLNTSPEQAQQYRNTLAGLLTEAQNAGVEDTKAITDMIASLNGQLPYEKMVDLKDQMDLYNKNFESIVGEGTYGSNKDYDTYIKNLDNIWYQASPEMRKNREFKLAYDTAKAAHAPKKKGKRPGAPKM